MDVSLSVDSGAAVPLHRQVYHGLRSAILAGRLLPGERLPATRVLAEHLSLSRQTVAEAYDQLRMEGYVEGRTGSGTYVVPDLPSAALSPEVDRRATPALSEWGNRVATEERAQAGEPRYDLRPQSVAVDTFPWDAWTSAVNRSLISARPALQSAPDPAGYQPLREAVAAHLRAYRSVRCSADQIVIVNGSQQGLNLLTQLLLERGDRVAVEDPGYPAARVSFEARGLEVVPVPVDADGMQVAALEPERPFRLVHVTPTHQHPTGATLSLSRRLALLELAAADGAWIVEDDYDSEFRYEGRPVESLQGLDRHDRVVYAGTFSKSVLPSLRVGYLVLPSTLIEPFVAAKSAWDSGTPVLEQAALAEFMQSGEYARHIRRMRRMYRERRDHLLAALRESFGDRANVGAHHGGMSVLVTLDTELTAEEIAGRAARAGIALRAADPFYMHPPEQATLLMGFAAPAPAAFREAVAALAALTKPN